ncbi:18426_t:CDS:2, partial [Entrophospora sp. SA101]
KQQRDAQAREQIRRIGSGFRLLDLPPITSFKSRYIPIQTNALFDWFCSIDFVDLGRHGLAMAEFGNDTLNWWRLAFNIDKMNVMNKCTTLWNQYINALRNIRRGLPSFTRGNNNNDRYDPITSVVE